MGHKHSEAFKLLTYRSDDGTEQEVLWNSRDGVTPFVITLASGKSATHVDWHKDVYAPNYEPQSGERIFIDLTPERAREFVNRNMDQWEKDGTFAKYGRPDPEELFAAYNRQGAPDIKVVE